MNNIIKNVDFPSRIIEEELYIIDPRNNRLHNFNKIGTYIWQILDKVSTYKEVVSMLIKEFDVDKQTAHEDLSEFIKILEEKDLVKLGV